MKNLKVSHKLILGFTIVALLACIVAIIGFIGMKKINMADYSLYENQTKPMGDISNIIDYLQRSRIKLRDLIVFGDDEEKVDTYQTAMEAYLKTVEEHISSFDKAAKDEETQKKYNEAKNLYTTMFKPLVSDIASNVREGTSEDNIYEIIGKYSEDIDIMLDDFNQCMILKEKSAKKTVEENSTLTQTMLIIIISVLIVTVILAIVLVTYISNMISKPIRLMSDFLTRFGTTGNITITSQDEKNISDANNDEIGICIKACAAVVSRLMDLNENFAKIANGDLTVNVIPLSDKDNMGIAISKMVKSLNSMFHEIRSSSDNVASGAEQIAQVTEQIAQGAQSLADGSSEQSASVQELLSSSAHIKKQVEENTKLANECVDNVNISGELMEKSVTSMGEMMVAMSAIDESSKSIANVIKVIDDIAAQTNLLALNAAIEASRVGDAGKGFAVVADEVRKLSAMSAEAAKETAELVENSISHVNHGSKIVEQTNQNLEAASKKTMEIDVINKEMADSLNQQSIAISKMNSAINEVSEVIQSNGAAAEESAAAAEESASVASEISSQAITLNKIVKKFELSS